MGTKPAPLTIGERMWLRRSTVSGHRGGWCWVLAPLVPEGMDPALYQTRGVRILVDDGSGRPMAEQLPEARNAIRILTVARGQLVAGGTATQMRQSRQAEAAHQHWLDEQARKPAALEATYGTQV